MGRKMSEKINPHLFYEERQNMVKHQLVRRGIHNQSVLQAFREIPRHIFVPSEYINQAYEDHPLPIGYGQTISQPYIVAYMTEQLALSGGETILEIGTGSGYQAAILSKLAKQIHTVEKIPQLAKKAKKTLSSLGIDNVSVHTSDGSLGWKQAAPYQVILVTASAPSAPQALLDQLALGGLMVIPVGSRWNQVLELWRHTPQGYQKENLLPVVFVPLKGQQGWGDSDW